MQSVSIYRLIWILVCIVLATGLIFPPLMDYDAAEYAGIAMTMYQRHDWLNIVNRQYAGGALYDYLDKPHMLFWSAMAGFKIFGINHIGYRFFSVLLSLAAAFATGQLGKHLYNKEVGKWAALMFITAQAILLANHDVRTDSLLTSFVILSIWQLVLFIDTKKWLPLLAGFIFLAMAVGTKGMIAALTTGCVLFFYLVGKKDWKGIFNWKWLAGIVFFFIGLAPFLYAYYLQFDQHPEKFVNGAFGTSGVKFLLWSQSFERFAGDRSFTNSPEFSFFYHTILWAFLPWSILLVLGVFNRLKELVQTRFISFFEREQLTFAGVWVMFNIMSLSKFKLPHYLNILFPLMAIFSAAYVWELYSLHKQKLIRTLLLVHRILIGLLLVAAVILITWAFPIENILIFISALGILSFILYINRLKFSVMPDRLILFTAAGTLLVNFILNAQFYPQLGKYQSGNTMAKQIQEARLDPGSIYCYGTVVRTFDFYSGRYVPMLDSAGIRKELQAGKSIYVFTPAPYGDSLLLQYPKAKAFLTSPDKHITKLKLSFLDPEKRMKGLPVSTLFTLEPGMIAENP
jgi:4-amino-4-deoxy-L-arabinose transferase-like glycosyltransferase